MTRRFVFAILLLWCLTLCLAEPGRNSKLRAERKKKAQEEQEEAKRQQLLNMSWEYETERGSIADYWRNRTDDAADSASLVYAMTRLDTTTLQQSYLFIVHEYKDGVPRRQSGCRDAIGRDGRERGYFKCLDISDWTFNGLEKENDAFYLETFNKLFKTMALYTLPDGTTQNATEVAMNARFKLRHWRNMDVTFRFGEGEAKPVKLRRKDWLCFDEDESFDNIYCVWIPEDEGKTRIEPYYWQK